MKEFNQLMNRFYDIPILTGWIVIGFLILAAILLLTAYSRIKKSREESNKKWEEEYNSIASPVSWSGTSTKDESEHEHVPKSLEVSEPNSSTPVAFNLPKEKVSLGNDEHIESINVHSERGKQILQEMRESDLKPKPRPKKQKEDELKQAYSKPVNKKAATKNKKSNGKDTKGSTKKL